MKSTGVIRRIDSLGRVVLPKELRRTLHIHDGDPLEIYINTEGGIVLKKYSLLGELSTYAQQYADVISKFIKLPMLVCDRDRIVSATGVSRKEYLECHITLQLEECMQSRKIYISTEKSEITPIEGMNQAAAVICPIIASSDVVGAVILMQNRSEGIPDQSEITLVQVAASLLGKQMEQ